MQKTSECKVPWEPHKGAVSNTASCQNSPQTHTSPLIRYTTSTDLHAFNKARSGDYRALTEFTDARFYPDAYFAKLSAQFKDRLEKPVSIVRPSSQGSAKPDRGLKYLEEQLSGCQQQLEKQTHVNMELKRLLVAALGEHNADNLESLVSAKLTLEKQLQASCAEIGVMSEAIERLGIRCDLWRSKYYASKALADELSAWKHFLATLVSESQALVRALLVRNEINVRRIERAHDKLMAQPVSLVEIASELKKPIVGKMKLCDVERMDESELLARQMLEQFQWLPFALGEIKSADEMEIVIRRLIEKRGEMIERNSRLNDDLSEEIELGNFYINCCKQCKGPLHIV